MEIKDGKKMARERVRKLPTKKSGEKEQKNGTEDCEAGRKGSAKAMWRRSEEELHHFCPEERGIGIGSGEK